MVLCDMVGYWYRDHLITLEESFLDCSQQLGLYLYRNRGILSWIEEIALMTVRYFNWVIDIEIDGCDMRRLIYAPMLTIMATFG